ncbi:hypothetical protein [Kitasatospora camelliae]|uniref:Uncharacterized protein n=1 Tax=Kitasatospora camelliae TaxID=3156397 RepID=A0AAU8K1B0_9ACTN
MNPWHVRWRWERDIPLRYVLTTEARGPEEAGGQRLLARCAGVEGLFADPPPPVREELVLFECAPRGRLADASVARTAGGPATCGSR